MLVFCARWMLIHCTVPNNSICCWILQKALRLAKYDTLAEIPGTKACRRALTMALVMTASEVIHAHGWLEKHEQVFCCL